MNGRAFHDHISLLRILAPQNFAVFTLCPIFPVFQVSEVKNREAFVDISGKQTNWNTKDHKSKLRSNQPGNRFVTLVIALPN